MKCKQVSNLASWYLDGDLPPGKRSEIEAHLSECRACRAEVEAMRRAVSVLDRPKTVFEPPDVLAAVKNEVMQRRSFMPAYRWGLAAACTVAIIVGIWLGVCLHNPNLETTPQLAVTQPEQPKPVVKPERPAPPAIANNPIVKPEAREKPHVRPGRRIATKPPVPEVAPPPKPEIKYLVVFNPEPPVAEDAYLESQATEGTVTSSYSIRAVDEATGDVTTLEVRREEGPGSEENTVIRYEVEDAEPHGDEERSPENEGFINRIDSAADLLVT